MSLKKFAEELKKGPEITDLFKTPAKELTAKKITPILKLNENNVTELQKAQKNSTLFVRGEIEDEKVLNAMTQYLQMSLLRSRFRAEKNDWSGVIELLDPWLVFAADFAYEEASLVGLHFCAVVRSLVLDELENFAKKSASSIVAKGRIPKWLQGARAPWPVDRVILSEARRVLGNRGMNGAEKVAVELQKNPYQTAEKVLIDQGFQQRKDLEFLKNLWREDDIQLLKTEVNRLGRLRLKLAQVAYLEKMKKEPASAQDLEKQGFIDKVPTDYFTGHPMSL